LFLAPPRNLLLACAYVARRCEASPDVSPLRADAKRVHESGVTVGVPSHGGCTRLGGAVRGRRLCVDDDRSESWERWWERSDSCL
jgi:hypothetical protein